MAITLDEMKEQLELFKGEVDSGLRPKARPTFTLADNGKTCKTCVHAVKRWGGNKTYHKCLLNQNRWTAGLATDIRLKDPACGLYEERDAKNPDTL